MFDSSVILVAEHDERSRQFLAAQLAADGADVYLAEDTAQARARAATHEPQLVLLGCLGAPPQALAFLRHLRAGDGLHGEPHPDLRVLVVVDDGHDLAVLRAFDAGADDVVGRTASYAVLRARARALLHRERASRAPARHRIGALELDSAAREVRLRGQLIDLSAKEFALLSALIAEPTRVFTKAELLRDVWGFETLARTRTLDSHACRLRAKLTAVAGDRFVLNVWGVGYRLIDSMGSELTRAA
jgi:DNA-binding response OmpR family regulator